MYDPDISPAAVLHCLPVLIIGKQVYIAIVAKRPRWSWYSLPSDGKHAVFGTLSFGGRESRSNSVDVDMIIGRIDRYVTYTPCYK